MYLNGWSRIYTGGTMHACKARSTRVLLDVDE